MDIKSWFQRFRPQKCYKTKEAVNLPSRPEVRNAASVGLLIITVFIGGFMLWALLFPLDSAAVAEGQVKVYANKKSIQHLEGGIVKEIKIREGQAVTAGQALIILDGTKSKADTAALRKQILALTAFKHRLLAERDDLDFIPFPEYFSNLKNADIISIKKTQEKIFHTRRGMRDKNIKFLLLKIKQLKQEVTSLEQQHHAAENEMEHLQQERDAVLKLAKNKYIEQTALIRLNRQLADESGEKLEILANIARAKQRVNDAELAIIKIKSDYLQTVVRELRDTQEKLAVLNEKLKSADAISTRTIIKAPITGRIVNLNIHTQGAVVAPGETLMQIVPTKGKLVIQARVNPLDIDVVDKGMEAYVQLNSLKARHAPSLQGKVLHVSADSIEDERTGQMYYLAELSLNPASIEILPKEVALKPGMPVQVMIITNRQTPFNYFITPITDSFNKAFRED